MRNGNLEVTLVSDKGTLHEMPGGLVSAERGLVYRIRLHNHGARRAVVHVAIDGRDMTEGGLVINARSRIDLERPVHDSEVGMFTVFPEGDTKVFGESGGRDNQDLGLIEVTHQMEAEVKTVIRPMFVPVQYPPYTPYPYAPYNNPIWLKDTVTNGDHIVLSKSMLRSANVNFSAEPMGATEPTAQQFRNSGKESLIGGCVRGPVPEEPAAAEEIFGHVEEQCLLDSDMDISLGSAMEEPSITANMRAAGTGLTGKSDQSFVPVSVGVLEATITTVLLRLVLGAQIDWNEPRPLPGRRTTPPRPEPRG